MKRVINIIKDDNMFDLVVAAKDELSFSRFRALAASGDLTGEHRPQPFHRQRSRAIASDVKC